MDKEKYKAELKKKVGENKELKRKILDLVDKSAFMIEDPFDYSYNPGKTIKLSNHSEIDYIEKLKYMY